VDLFLLTIEYTAVGFKKKGKAKGGRIREYGEEKKGWEEGLER